MVTAVAKMIVTTCVRRGDRDDCGDGNVIFGRWEVDCNQYLFEMLIQI